MADSQHSHRSSLKQQNKPFKPKGRTQPRKKSSGRTTATSVSLPTSSMDWISMNKQDRANYLSQRRQKQREDLSMKRRGLSISKPGSMDLDSRTASPKILGVFGTNGSSNIESVVELMRQQCSGTETGVWQCPDWAVKGLSLQVMSVPRDVVHLLDVCKVADVLILVLNCSDVDYSAIKLDPDVSSPFDQFTYSCLTALRAQGLPKVIGWLQGLDTVTSKKQKEVKKLIKRFFESEIAEGKFVVESDLQNAFRAVAVAAQASEEVHWRQSRMYLSGQNVAFDQDTNELSVSGFVRGSGHLNANQLVHITGYGDFQLHCIEALGQVFVADSGAESLITENDPGPFCAEQTWPQDEDLVTAMNTLAIVKTDHDAADLEESDSGDEMLQVEENVKPVQLTTRTKTDMEFPDEVDTPADQPARTRFQRYRGLKSFRTSPWDPYESLPKEYSRLHEFKEASHAVRKVALEQVQAASQVTLGIFCTLKIKNVPKTITEHPISLPLIVSSVLPYERRLTVMHYKLARWGDTESPVESKETVTFHSGFRRFCCQPIYSEDAVNENKSKFVRKFLGAAVASLYAPAQFPPANVLVFKSMSKA